VDVKLVTDAKTARQCLTDHNLSQTVIANQLGINRQTLNNYLKGHRIPESGFWNRFQEGCGQTCEKSTNKHTWDTFWDYVHTRHPASLNPDDFADCNEYPCESDGWITWRSYPLSPPFPLGSTPCREPWSLQEPALVHPRRCGNLPEHTDKGVVERGTRVSVASQHLNWEDVWE